MRSYSILKYQRHKPILYWTIAVSKHTKAGNKDSFPTSVSHHRDGEYSEVIDVRTPDEFSADHIPGSINLPVLSNQERINIGTLYHSNSFEARKRGAGLISRNISEHLDKHFLNKSKDFSPLVYCWRGGQRSYSLGMVLAQIGFQTCVLDGGYKSYRSQICEELKTQPDQFCYRVISGMTGSGKTLILNALHVRGEQVLDLEALAKHKGSVLGLWHNETQPSQKLWESHLVQRLSGFTPDRPVWVESESRRIGTVAIPEQLFNNIRHSHRFCINLPLQERVKHILHCYPNWAANTEQLKQILSVSLTKVVGKETVKLWHDMIDQRKGDEFVSHMLLNHYDPTYTHSQKKNNESGVVIDCDITDLSDTTVDKLVNDLIDKGNQSTNPEHIQALNS